MATIPANNNTGLYNTSGVPAVTGNDLTVSGNVNANNINAVNTVNAGTSITAGTNITAGGNVTADYFIGDGSLLTNINAGNIVGSYGNANVATYLASGTVSSNIVTTGNVSGTYILGNGSQLTGLPATYSNANVDAHLAAFGSNTIVTTGNITGGYFIGDGSLLTGLPASYGNANVAAYLPTFTGNLAGGNANITNDLTVGGTIYGTFSGNISGNLVVPGSNTQVLFNNSGNAGASADFTFNDATNLLTVSGNVNATAFNGSGAGLTSITGANVTGTVANATYATSAGTATTATSATTAGTVTTAAQPNITSVGTLTSLTTSGNVDVGGSLNTDDVTSTGNVTVNGNQVITGNLTVQGTTTTINSNTITTNDKTITVANNQSTGANVDGSGLEAGNPAVATFLYDNATTTWKSSIGLSAVGNVTGNYIVGNGSRLTSLSGANVIGVVTSAASATTAGTVTTAAQPNITSVGTLSSLTVTNNVAGFAATITQSNATGGGLNIRSGDGSGSASMLLVTDSSGGNQRLVIQEDANTIITNRNISLVGNVNVSSTLNMSNTLTNTGNIVTGNILTNGYYYANGTPVSFGGSSYGNANVADFMANYGANTISSTGNITTTANISGAYILGNGSQLTGLPATYTDANVTTLLASLGSNVISSTANITTTANVSGAYVIGNGSALSSITGANITGTVANATYATSAGSAATATDAAHATVADSANTVAGANVTGTVANATYATSAGTATTSTTAGTVTTNAQPNITSVGTLTSLGVTGNIAGGNLSVTGQVTAGGNISGNYLLGNISGATGGYSNAIAAAYLASGTNSSNIITTGNVTATYISTTGVAGNITGANYVTANYFVGDGSLLTNLPAGTYGDSNVTSLLASFGSNSISTTGNVTTGNLLMSGRLYDTSGVFQIDSVGNIVLAPTGSVTTPANVVANYFVGNGSQLTGITASLSGNLTGNINTGSYYITSPGAEVLMGNVWVTGTLAANTISAPAGDYVNIEGIASTNGLNSSGNINALNQKSVNFYETGSTNYLGLKAPSSVAADVVWTLPGTDGTTGQALSTYGNGVMYWATGGGGGSPGGSDTQIQFNDGGSFAGNAAITFSKTTGNIGLGNLIVNTQQIQTTQTANVGLTTSLVPNPGRVVIGSGYNGNTSPAYDQANAGRTARLLVTDTYGITDANSAVRGAVTQNFYTLNANIAGANARIGGSSSSLTIGGGASANTSSVTTPFGLTAFVSSVTIGGGTSGNLTGLGNTTVLNSASFTSVPTINPGSTGGNIYGAYIQSSSNGTANTLINLGMNFNGTGTFGNTYGVYMAGGTNNYGISSANNPRNANYWFLKNDDDHSYSDVGQLTQYQETQYALASSGGAVTVNKNNGQVQFFTVSEDATVSFSNFVVSSTVSTTTRYMTDTVTLIVQQDGTGRTITLPTPSSTYKYAAGSNTIPTTASSVSMVSITAIYNTVGAATQYLITISPEFT